jgi:hypothetical protein
MSAATKLSSITECDREAGSFIAPRLSVFLLQSEKIIIGKQILVKTNF